MLVSSPEDVGFFIFEPRGSVISSINPRDNSHLVIFLFGNYDSSKEQVTFLGVCLLIFYFLNENTVNYNFSDVGHFIFIVIHRKIEFHVLDCNSGVTVFQGCSIDCAYSVGKTNGVCISEGGYALDPSTRKSARRRRLPKVRE